MEKTEQYLNRMSEPKFTRRLPCEGCKGLTKMNYIEIECWECRGEGWLEDDDLMWNPKGWRDCYACDGRGYWKRWLRYCGDECYYYDNYEDFN